MGKGSGKKNKRLEDKVSPLYVEQREEADLGTTVFIKGMVVHKDNLRKNFSLNGTRLKNLSFDF